MKIYIAVGDPVIKRGGVGSTFFVHVPSHDLDFQHHVVVFFFGIQQVKVGGDCLFCCGIVDNNCSDFFLTSDELGYQSSPNQINGSL